VREKLPLQALRNIAIGLQGGIQPKGDINLSKWLLERKMSKEYGETIKLQDTGEEDDGVPKEDKEVINELHTKLKINLIERSREKAKKDGEIKND